jgi:hypothetical protein
VFLFFVCACSDHIAVRYFILFRLYLLVFYWTPGIGG